MNILIINGSPRKKHTGQNLSREEYKQMLLQFYPNLKRWEKQ